MFLPARICNQVLQNSVFAKRYIGKLNNSNWLCKDEIFESENGVSIYGKSGKFETRPISAEQVRRTWSEYLKAVDNKIFG